MEEEEGDEGRVCIWKIREEKEGNADYGGKVQPSQQHVAPCVNEVRWGLGTSGLKGIRHFRRRIIGRIEHWSNGTFV